MSTKTKVLPWQDASEIVAGLVLSNRLSCNAVRPELFISPYDEIIKFYKAGKTDIDILIENVGISPIQSALDAQKSLNGLGDMANWVSILENSAVTYNAGNQLEKTARLMQQGKPVDLAKVKSIFEQFRDGKTSTQPLAEIESSLTPFIKSGWKVIDDHLGGLPEVGLITIGGNPGVGKTSLMARLAGSYAREHKDKIVIIYSLEMIKPEIAMRIREVLGHNRSNLSESSLATIKEVENRVYINDLIFGGIGEIVNDAARFENVGLIVIDFADLLVSGEVSESKMGEIYKGLSNGAKSLHCTAVLISQLNRSYSGGIPRPYHIRYTGMAEALSYMLWMLYNPTNDYFEEDEESQDLLPYVEDHAYIIVWKCRGGFRVHENDSPGAICVPWKGARGWHPTNSKWYMLKKGR